MTMVAGVCSQTVTGFDSATACQITGTELPADLYEYENNIVNGLDLQVFVDYWLCYWPTSWPLK